MPFHLITTCIFKFLDALDTQIAKSVENRFCKVYATNFVDRKVTIGFGVYAMLAEYRQKCFKVKQSLSTKYDGKN